MKKLNLKESHFSIIGVIITIFLYAMNVFGTGIIVGGDVGHIGSGIPYYGFAAPFLFIAFAAFVGYYTKRNSIASAFKAIYITLLLPFIAYPLCFVTAGVLILIPMYLFMPVGSLVYYLEDNICELLGYKYYESPDWLLISIIAVLLLPSVIAPVVYKFTKTPKD